MSLHEVVETSAAPPQAVREPPRRRRAARVLIVDDMAENRLALRLCCERFGYPSECVEGGYEAVDAVRSGRFDLVLMDILMPRLDGLAAAKVIRGLPEPVSSIPILALSTSAAPGEVLRYITGGMTDVVPKPIVATRLAEAMSAALAKAKRERARGGVRAAA
jgi:CheY-like chemotaxis protein